MVFKLLQRKLLYHPRRAQALNVCDFRDITQIFADARDVQFVCSDGITIRGWLLQKQSPLSTGERSRPLIMFFHGNASHRATRTRWYRLFADAGADVLAIDYHGYGDSDGRMSERALEVSCDATWEFATSELNVKPQQIIVVGTSLGGAAAVYTAWRASQASRPPCGMMGIATFSSMVDVASSLYPWLPVRRVLVDRYPSDVRIADVCCPISIVHGTDDQLVHANLGQRLFAAAPKTSSGGVPKRWVPIDGAGHNDILPTAAKTLRTELITMISHSSR